MRLKMENISTKVKLFEPEKELFDIKYVPKYLKYIPKYLNMYLSTKGYILRCLQLCSETEDALGLLHALFIYVSMNWC